MIKEFYFLIVLIACILASFREVEAQVPLPEKLWDKRFKTDKSDILVKIINRENSGFMLFGYSYANQSGDKSTANYGQDYSSDFWVMNIDVLGNKIWDNSYGGNLSDIVRDVISTEDLGYILVGNSESDVSGNKNAPKKGQEDVWIVKIDALGNKLWDRSFGGDKKDYAFSIISTSDGGYLVVAASNSIENEDRSEEYIGALDIWLIKIDADGNKIWDKTIGGTGNDILRKILPGQDGGYILFGDSRSPVGYDKSSEPKGLRDYWIVKVDDNGNKIWDKTYGGEQDDLLIDAVFHPDGGYLVGGVSQSPVSEDRSQSRGREDYWILRLDVNGDKLWDRTYGGSNIDFFTSMLALEDKNFILAGYSYSGVGYEKTEYSKGKGDCWIIKIDANGNKIWDKTYGGSGNELLSYIVNLSNKDFLIGSSTFSEKGGDVSDSGITTEYDYWLIRSSEVPTNSNIISGYAYIDSNENCIYDDFETPLVNWGIRASSLDRVIDVQTDDNGFYSMNLGKGSYSINIIPPPDSSDKLSLYKIICPNQGLHRLNLDGENEIITDLNWALDNEIPNLAQGRVFFDKNKNCIYDTNDTPFINKNIQASSLNRQLHTITDDQGYYTFGLDTNKYEIIISLPYHNLIIDDFLCPSEEKYTVKFEGFGGKSKGLDFSIDRKECAILNVDITSNRRLRCFQGQTTITYQNEGITSAEDAYIEVQIPEFTIPISSDIPWTSYDESTRLMTFELGTLAAGDFGQIILTDSIACVDEAFNQSQCTEARIYPKNTCNPPDPNWSGADLQVKGNCFVLFDPLAQFTITNQGTGDMTTSTAYRLYSDSSLIYEGTLQLTAEDDFNLEIPTGGKSIHIEVDQVPFHPENTQVSTSVEGCGQKATQVISKSAALDFPQNDDNFDFEVSCLPIVGSYDPNDKLVSPAGFTDQHYVAPGTRMEYTIRFQNTGTFMAFTVKVIDTLSADLDVATFEMMSASHDYNLDLQTTARWSKYPHLDF